LGHQITILLPDRWSMVRHAIVSDHNGGIGHNKSNPAKAKGDGDGCNRLRRHISSRCGILFRNRIGFGAFMENQYENEPSELLTHWFFHKIALRPSSRGIQKMSTMTGRFTEYEKSAETSLFPVIVAIFFCVWFRGINLSDHLAESPFHHFRNQRRSSDCRRHWIPPGPGNWQPVRGLAFVDEHHSSPRQLWSDRNSYRRVRCDFPSCLSVGWRPHD
jgi:hypothetical protein